MNMISSPEIIDEIFRYDVPLQRYTSFRTGGAAEIFVEPGNTSELKKVLQFCRDEQKKVFILGKGTNLLVNDNGVKGVVIHLGGVDFKEIKIEGRHVLSGAGVGLAKLIRKSALSGLEGLEGLVGIPGTVGGAVMMNAGGKYGDISDTIDSLTTMTFDGKITKHSRDDVEFAYRGCNLSGQIVVNVEFTLKESKIEVVLEKMDEIYKEKKKNNLYQHLMPAVYLRIHNTLKPRNLLKRQILKGRR